MSPELAATGASLAVVTGELLAAGADAVTTVDRGEVELPERESPVRAARGIESSRLLPSA